MFPYSYVNKNFSYYFWRVILQLISKVATTFEQEKMAVYENAFYRSPTFKFNNTQPVQFIYSSHSPQDRTDSYLHYQRRLQSSQSFFSEDADSTTSVTKTLSYSSFPVNAN